MRSSDGKRRRVLSQEERTLWTTVTRSIAPLRESAGSEQDEAVPSAPARTQVHRAASRAAAAPVSRSDDAPPLVPLGRRAKKRVVRGKEPIDGRLDLHGLTQSEAHAALLRFLRAACSRGARLVLIITGKGAARTSEDERGILKRQVPKWLSLPEFRPLVIGYEDAHVTHGGEGALYVRVRRARRA